MSRRLDGKTVLVTGAAGNLGRAVTGAFATEGARILLLDRDAATLRKAYPDAMPALVHVPADLGDPASVAAAVAGFERIDVLCNLAGGFRMGEPVHETSAETWDFLLGLNARSIIHTARAVVPRMIAARAGKIINIGAASALKGQPLQGAYCASKAAVLRLTESMSAELRRHAINVNCVLPSTLDTPENRQAMPDADPKRWVRLESLAGVILFLASPEAADIHGASLPVTGAG